MCHIGCHNVGRWVGAGVVLLLVAAVYILVNVDTSNDSCSPLLHLLSSVESGKSAGQTLLCRNITRSRPVLQDCTPVWQL